MARKITRWLALTDIANRINAGTAYELSAIEAEGKLLLFQRVAGTVFWQPVANERKIAQVAYKLSNLAALIQRVAVLSCQFEFYMAAMRFSNAAPADPFEVRLAAKWAELSEKHHDVILGLLTIENNAEAVSAIAAKIMYEYEKIDPISVQVLKTLLPWPEGQPPLLLASEAPKKARKRKPPAAGTPDL